MMALTTTTALRALRDGRQPVNRRSERSGTGTHLARHNRATQAPSPARSPAVVKLATR